MGERVIDRAYDLKHDYSRLRSWLNDRKGKDISVYAHGGPDVAFRGVVSRIDHDSFELAAGEIIILFSGVVAVRDMSGR